MSKTAADVKKGLEYLSITNVAEKVRYAQEGLPYAYTEEVAADALALIRQLESDNQQLEGLLHHMNQLRDAAAGRALKMEERVHQLEAERDALIGYIRTYGCVSCLYIDYDGSEPPCINCELRDMWVFEGVQKEE